MASANNQDSSGQNLGLWTSRTNAADDSRGMAFGLEGDLFIPVVVGASLGVMVFTVMLLAGVTSMEVAFFWSFLPFGVSLAYVLLLRHGKPKHYDMDLFEDLVTGGDGWQRLEIQPRHPRREAREWDAKQKKQIRVRKS